MDFIDQVKLLSKRVETLKDQIQTEENRIRSKGSLAYYADILNKYSDVAQIVGNLLVKWTAF